MEVCPIAQPSEFDAGISTRKAIYMPFPQAVPNSYLVDAAHCTYLQSDGKKCGACLQKCPKECIHFDEKDEVVELEVGNIVVATGYDVFDAHADRALRLRPAAQRADRPRVRAPDQRLRSDRRHRS